MNQTQRDKGRYYRELKAAGVKFDKPYRNYTIAELQQAYTTLTGSPALPPTELGVSTGLPRDSAPPAEPEPAADLPQASAPPVAAPPPAPTQARSAPRPEGPRQSVPRGPRNENEMPGQRLNSKPEDQPLRVDDEGLLWYQEEVPKPAFPKPRGRRVLKYMETGTKTETVKNGDYMETFEVSGDEQSRPAEVKITLPSYQVGIYKDPRLPFRIHVYNSKRGFDLFEVHDYYGGHDLVPDEVKRTYVENVLCYDIRTTVRAIQTEYRQLQLAGKVK